MINRFRHITAIFLLLILSLATLPGAFYHQFEKHHDDAINHCNAEGHIGKHIEETQIHCDIFNYEAPVFIEDFHWIIPSILFRYIETTFSDNISTLQTDSLARIFNRGPPMIN